MAPNKEVLYAGFGILKVILYLLYFYLAVVALVLIALPIKEITVGIYGLMLALGTLFGITFFVYILVKSSASKA